MKTQTHTPGPWNWDEMDGRIYITPTSRPCHYIADINSKQIDPEGDYPRQRQREANAALIASAPDLLAIVSAIAESFSAGAAQVYAEALAPHTDDETLHTWISKTLAKAKGE